MLTLNPGDIFADHYRLVRLIDTGGFADVWEAVFLSAGNTVALKIYPRLDEEGVQNIEDEYRNQADLSHSHLLIARYFGKHNGYPFLEMRYCSGGNASAKIGSCTEAEIAKVLYHISCALEYLHENNIVHQDIKPNNFLLDHNGNYYLADLGLSLRVRKTIKKFTQSRATQKSSFTGLTPPPYRSPELYDRANIGEQPIKATDIWALGASLYEMITGDMPFGELGGLNQYKNPEPPALPAGFSAQLNTIIGGCLAKEPWERPKASELQGWAHQYLQTGNYGIKPKMAMTIPDPGPVVDPHPEPKPEIVPPRKQRPVAVYILIATVVLTAAIWAISAAVKNPPLPPTKDSVVTKVVDSNTNSGNIAVKQPDSVKVNKIKDSGIIRDPAPMPVTPKVAITYSPTVDGPPRSGMISISKLERSADNLKIFFELRKRSGDDDKATFSIYGPESPRNCFFVVVEGQEHQYKLLNIHPSGQDLHFGSSGTFNFTATFQKIPDDARIIDIIEGPDRDRMDQNYWTFREVHVK